MTHLPSSETANLRAPLRKLALSPASVTNRKLWRAMTVQDRERALLALLRDKNSPASARRQSIVAIAKARNFRVETVERWEDAKLAMLGAKLDILRDDLVRRAVTALHVHDRAPMLIEFLDRLSIPHDAGKIRDDQALAASIEFERVSAAASALLESNAIDDVVLYLLALRIDSPVFANLDDWLVAQAGGDAEPLPVVVEAEPGAHTLDVAEFTTLDRRLIRTIVDAKARVIGAASEEEIDDLLLEMEQLNSSRHSTFFHSGFRDSLFAREPVLELPAENDARRRWYWSGYISGLARRDMWSEIVSLFDGHQPVRNLGAAGDGPARAAADLIFHALTRAERYAEAGTFSRPPAVAASEKLRVAMLGTATELIHRFRATDARPLLDTLRHVMRQNTGESDDSDDRFAVDVQRRRALCLRQLGERDESLSILHTLAGDPDPVVSAIAHTDIGLIQAGFRNLGEIALPKEHAELPTLIESLKRGETEWKIATTTKGFSPAHAHFALGVLALAQENYDEADHRLGRAEATFSGAPDVYSGDGSLGLVQLYLGIAICLTLKELGRLTRARELICAGLNAGAKLPLWLVTSTVDALAMQNGDLAGQTVSAILEHAGDGFLDELIASASTATIPAIRPALFRRAASPSRSNTCRVQDYRRVLPWLLEAQEIDKARDALDFLEQAAMEQTGRAEFINLLQRRADLSPAWSDERCADASVRLLEMEGRFAEATLAVDVALRRLLALDDPSSLDNADLLLLELEGYGPEAAETLDRLRPVIDARIAIREREETQAADRLRSDPNDAHVEVRILVVGGDEMQARMDADIRATIADELPGVTIVFLHTGFGSNWSAHVEQFDREVARADGVVLLQLMRTMFGRSIRARCHLPWRGCRGRGQGEIVNTIKRVVPVARARMNDRTPSLV